LANFPGKRKHEGDQQGEPPSKKFKTQESVWLPIKPVDTNQKLVSLPLSYAALDKKSETKTLLFMREPVKLLLEHLNQNTAISLIEGPPGSGKSSIVFLWCWNIACVGNKSVCWIHLSELSCSVCILKDSKLKQETLKLDQISTFLDSCDETVLVIDGVVTQFKSVVGIASFWQKTATNRLLILVTSVQLFIKEEELQANDVSRWDAFMDFRGVSFSYPMSLIFRFCATSLRCCRFSKRKNRK